MIRNPLVAVACIVLMSRAICLPQDDAAKAAATDAQVEAVAIQAAPAAIPDAVIEQAIKRELAILKEITKLSDDAIAGLELGLRPMLPAEKRRLAKAQGGRSTFIPGMTSLTEPMMQAISRAAATLVSNELSKKYQNDVRLRLEFNADSAAAGFVQSLDSLSGLTSKQRPAAVDLAKELHSKNKLSGAMYNLSGMMPGGISAGDLKGVLTEEQLARYKELNSFTTVSVVLTGTEQESSEDKHREELAKQLRAVAAMKIEYLDAELDLSPAQAKKLQLVGKSVVSRAIDQRLEAEVAYRRYIDSMQAGNAQPPDMDMEMISIATSHPVHLFEAQDRWAKFVQSTLNDDQKAAMRKLEKARQETMREALGYMLVTAFRRELKLTGEQQRATHKLITASFGPMRSFSPNGASMMETYATLLDVSEADYTNAMGADNWAIFEPQLDQLRQRLKVTREQREAKKEDK